MVFHYKLIKPIIMLVQGFFKDMTVQCFVLNTGQSVLQVMMFSFLLFFQVSKISAKMVIQLSFNENDRKRFLKYNICVLYHHGSNSYDFLSSMKYKRRNLTECSCSSFHKITVNGE